MAGRTRKATPREIGVVEIGRHDHRHVVYVGTRLPVPEGHEADYEGNPPAVSELGSVTFDRTKDAEMLAQIACGFVAAYWFLDLAGFNIWWGNDETVRVGPGRLKIKLVSDDLERGGRFDLKAGELLISEDGKGPTILNAIRVTDAAWRAWLDSMIVTALTGKPPGEHEALPSEERVAEEDFQAAMRRAGFACG